MVARSIKFLLLREMAFLEKELLQACAGLGQSVSKPVEIRQKLQPYLNRVMELGVGRLELYDNSGKLAYSLYPHRQQMVDAKYAASIDDKPGVSKSKKKHGLGLSALFERINDIS